jgi:regulator of protease activity HflC (stomatin/prohibitin superfamily)
MHPSLRLRYASFFRVLDKSASPSGMKVFWFFFSKKNRKRFFLQKEAKTLILLELLGGLMSVPNVPSFGMRPGSRAGLTSTIVAGAVILALLLIWLFRPFTIVDGGYVGVKTFFGAPEQGVLGSGFHFIVPVAETVYEVSTQPQLASTTETASTNDQQNVSTGVSVNFTINPTEAVTFWKNYRDIPTLTQTIIAPIVSNDTKAVTAVYNAQELITRREGVRQEIEQDVRTDLAQYRVVIVTGVNITNFSYSDAYNQAIDAKQVAQQTALEEQYKLQQVQISAQQQVAQADAQASAAVDIAQGQAKATILQAQADAEAYKLKQQGLTADILMLSAIQRWNGQLPQYMSGSTPLPFLQLGGTASPAVGK